MEVMGRRRRKMSCFAVKARVNLTSIGKSWGRESLARATYDIDSSKSRRLCSYERVSTKIISKVGSTVR